MTVRLNRAIQAARPIHQPQPRSPFASSAARSSTIHGHLHLPTEEGAGGTHSVGLLVAPDGGDVGALALGEPAEPVVPVLLEGLVGVLLVARRIVKLRAHA